MKRAVRNKIPQANTADPMSEIIQKYDSLQKMKIKSYADNKHYVKPCNISLGDSVLVKRQFTMAKGSTVYNPDPMTVVQRKGSMITAKNENTTLYSHEKFVIL